MEAFIKKQLERDKRQSRRERKDQDRFTLRARKRARAKGILKQEALQESQEIGIYL